MVKDLLRYVFRPAISSLALNDVIFHMRREEIYPRSGRGIGLTLVGGEKLVLTGNRIGVKARRVTALRRFHPVYKGIQVNDLGRVIAWRGRALWGDGAALSNLSCCPNHGYCQKEACGGNGLTVHDGPSEVLSHPSPFRSKSQANGGLSEKRKKAWASLSCRSAGLVV
jgi:hypothetical protein